MRAPVTDGVTLAQINGSLGLEFGAATGASRWDGARMDWAMAIEGLLSADHALELEPGARYPAHFPRRDWPP
jgi:hypothetical protein